MQDLIFNIYYFLSGTLVRFLLIVCVEVCLIKAIFKGCAFLKPLARVCVNILMSKNTQNSVNQLDVFLCLLLLLRPPSHTVEHAFPP